MCLVRSAALLMSSSAGECLARSAPLSQRWCAVGEVEEVVLALQVVVALKVLGVMVMVLVHQEVMVEEGPHQEEVMEQRDGKGGQLIHQEDVAEVMAVVVEAPVADMVEVVQVLEEVDQEAMVEDLEETMEDLEELAEGLVEEVAVGLFLANNVEQCRSSSVALFPGNSAEL